MSRPEIKNCPGTLAQDFSTYSPLALRRMFGGKKVSHILSYKSPGTDEADEYDYIENRKRISISGVQEKLSFVLEKNILRLTREGERGTYILKPIPRDIKHVNQVPANEHLTMQIARQVYGIHTAENALIFFDDGKPAYITLRFDVKPDGDRWRTEDFASLAGKSKDNGGADYKYHYSYEELGMLIKKYIPAWKVEIEKYYQLVVFNYLFSNGDAHLKNFGVLETMQGDFILCPAYDLLNTKLHVDDTDFGLDRKLFIDDYKSPLQKIKGNVTGSDFIEFGRRIGIPDKRVENLLVPFSARQDKVELLTSRSFLNESQKKTYLHLYNRKRNLLEK
jgi:serine/threonine-protein kinase HipA